MARQNPGDPLMQAALSGEAEKCRQLLENGAFVDAAEEDGTTALIAAACKGHTEVCRLLFEKGASVEAAGRMEGRPSL
jgi:ankyrin repeat protein